MKLDVRGRLPSQGLDPLTYPPESQARSAKGKGGRLVNIDNGNIMQGLILLGGCMWWQLRCHAKTTCHNSTCWIQGYGICPLDQSKQSGCPSVFVTTWQRSLLVPRDGNGSCYEW